MHSNGQKLNITKKSKMTPIIKKKWLITQKDIKLKQRQIVHRTTTTIKSECRPVNLECIAKKIYLKNG